MLLMDALGEIEERIRLILTDYISDKDFQKSKDYDSIRNYYQALLVAKKCIEAQMDLACLIDDMSTGKEEDRYSHLLVMELLQSVYAGEKVEE